MAWPQAFGDFIASSEIHRTKLPASRGYADFGKARGGDVDDGAAFADAGDVYVELIPCTETVTPFWLMLPPIDTAIDRLPDGAVAGICTLSCITPATSPGASPAYV
jgi:hypothetical protein